MKRRGVWWAQLPAPTGRRPVLLFSRDHAYAVRNAVTVAFITTAIRSIPVEVKLTAADGMPRECVVNLDLINTIPKAAIVQRVCELSNVRMAEVARAIQFAIQLQRWRPGLESQ